MSREYKTTSHLSSYDLGSQRQKERYGLAMVDMDEEDDTGGSQGGAIDVVIPFLEQKTNVYKPIVDEWGRDLAQLIEDKADEFTRLLMEGQGQFGAVSTQRKKRKKSQDNTAANSNQANMSQGYGAGGDLPQHPLLNGQRYDGIADNDSPLAAVSAQDELFENIAEQVEHNPELKLSPELSNNLKLRIDMYNQKKLENALTSRPTLTMDRMPGR